MKSKIRYKISPGKSISLLALLLFTNSLLFAQVENKAEKGSKHIKIEAEVDGKIINVDTVIPAGADFDHAAFLESLGLEGHAEMHDDGNGFSFEYETEDGKTIKKKKMEKRVEVEVEEGEDGEQIIKKRVYINDGDGENKVIKKKMSDGEEKIIIIKDGEVIEGDGKMIKKKMDGDNVIIIEKDSDEGTSTETKIWIDEDGKKHEIKKEKTVIIITDDDDKKEKKIKKKKKDK
ncbi:MAG: hypothetical protein HKN75_09330 [Bacteroidia bacterium]|nr:hypothetical protein [Bacteroidia bacterium]